MKQHAKKMILVGPDDVENHIDILREVIDWANILIPERPFEGWFWHTDSTPGLHLDGAQGLTDAKMDITSADLVVAVFWSRIGTPVLGAPSGTVHELERAWDAWRGQGTPDVWLYFSEQDVPQDALRDPRQFTALQDWRAGLPTEQSYFEFSDIDELRTMFMRHLHDWLKVEEPPPARSALDEQGILVPPDASRTVTREDQLRQLRESFLQSPVVCLHGIAGSGKTRLAAQYVQSPLRLPEHADQPFWYDVADGDTLDEMLTVFPSDFVGSGDSIVGRCKQLLATLRLRGQLLVIDDFHRANQATFDPLLRLAGLQRTPGVILLLSRVALLQPDVAEVPVRPWTAPEVADLLDQLGARPLPESLLARLTTKTGGLPLAVTFFTILVRQLGHDPATLLQGELTQTPRAQQWYSDIRAELTPSELALLRYFSLAEPFITDPVLRRAEARLDPGERSRAFTRLQTLLLVGSRGKARWAVHPFVAECTLADADPELVRRLLLDLCNFSRSGIRNLRPGQISHSSLAAGIRAARYAQKAGDTSQSAAIIKQISAAAKRLGHYRSLRDLCLWQMTADPRCDPWIRYHYAHCQLILGDQQTAVTVLAALRSGPAGSAINYASARILADARAQIGDGVRAAGELQQVLRQPPDGTKGAKATYAQARATMARLLIETDQLDDARALVSELARDTPDDRSLAVLMVLLGQIEGPVNRRYAEARFQSAIEKFRSVDDRRGLAWALTNLARTLVSQPGGNVARARRAAREAMAIYARIGGSTNEYNQWLTAIRPSFRTDVAMLSLIDHELARVSTDLGLSD
jgi:tetratricopeptide (TPR) repeat protein